MEFERDILEKLAEAAHEAFCESLRAKGYIYGPETREEEKTHSSLRPYAELTKEEKEQNRSFIRDIPNKLALAGYTLVPGDSRDTPCQFAEAEIQKLAKAEHERWMKQKLDSGWRHGESTNKAKKLHQNLVPWDELLPEEQDKDGALVAGIPAILAKAKYTVSKPSPLR